MKSSQNKQKKKNSISNTEKKKIKVDKVSGRGLSKTRF